MLRKPGDLGGRDLDRRDGAVVAYTDVVESERSNDVLCAIDAPEQLRRDADAELDPRRQAGEGGLLGDRETERARDGASHVLAERAFEQWVADAGAFPGPQARTKLTDVVCVRSGEDRRSRIGRRRDPVENAVQLGLAVETPERVVSKVRLALDLVRLDRPVCDPEFPRGPRSDLQLAGRIARRNRGDGLGVLRTERSRGQRENDR